MLTTRFSLTVLALFALAAPACSTATNGDGGDESDSSGDAIVNGNACTADVVEGVDTSHWNANVDWDAVKSAGMKFAFLKATEGTGYTDPSFATSWANAKSAGILRGAYHFFDPNADGVAQAKKLVSVLGSDVGELPPVLDFEKKSSVSAATLTKRVNDFLETVAQETGRTPIFYVSTYFIQDSGLSESGLDQYPLWLAAYTSSCGNAKVPSPWTKPRFWQYTENGSVAGISGKVDRDRFLGTLSDLQSFASGGVTMPDDPGAGSGGAGGDDGSAGGSGNGGSASSTGGSGNSGSGNGAGGSGSSGSGNGFGESGNGNGAGGSDAGTGGATPRGNCQSDADCATDQYCDTSSGIGQCAPLGGGGSGGSAGGGTDGACSFDEDCTSGFVCSNGSCTSACTGDVDCDAGQVCDRTGHCIAGNGSSDAGGSDASGGCQSSNDCPLGQICSGGSCIDGCYTDNDCPSGQTCDPNAMVCTITT